MSERMLFPATWGTDDPERATVPFILATVARASGQAATVVCTAEAVWLGTTGGADGIAVEGLPVLADLVSELLGAGGEIWLCSACVNKRGIGEGDLLAGVTIVGAARIVEEVAAGARSITLT